MPLERRNYPAKLIIAPCPWQPVSSDFLLSYPRRPPSSFLPFFHFFFFSFLYLRLPVCLPSNVAHHNPKKHVWTWPTKRYDTFSPLHATTILFLFHKAKIIIECLYCTWKYIFLFLFHSVLFLLSSSKMLLPLPALWLPIEIHALQVLLERKHPDNASFQTPSPTRLIVAPRMLSYSFWVAYT